MSGGFLCLLLADSNLHQLFSGGGEASLCPLASLDSMLLSAQRS